MILPRTPAKKSGEDLREIVNLLNDQFALDLPNPLLYSPSVHHNESSLGWQSYTGIKRLYFGNADLNAVINDFEEWVSSREMATRAVKSFPAGPNIIPSGERDERLKYLKKLIYDAIYLLTGGAYPSFTSRDSCDERRSETPRMTTTNTSPLKRRLSDGDEEFHTAPNSPVKNTAVPAYSTPLDMGELHRAASNPKFRLDPVSSYNGTAYAAKRPRLSGTAGPSKFVEKLTTPDRPRYDLVSSKQDMPRFSFSTATNSFTGDPCSTHVEGSFSTDITEPVDVESSYGDSIAGHLLSQEASFGIMTTGGSGRSTDAAIVDELLQRGPFSTEQSFPASIPLRYRYELERIGRAWNVPFDRMLVGKSISLCYQEFWKWIERHNQRDGKTLPEKCSRATWDAATGDFKTDRHSEAVVLTGDLDWCSKSEPGILKLKLNPLRMERSCRFHRRFGSDRFMTLTIPAPARPPNHLRLSSQPGLLRESIAEWLTQNTHQCLGRAWRPFYVEEVKVKRKSNTAEPKFRVEFFAIDGIDFGHGPFAPWVAPVRQSCDKHVPMSLESLIEWHMPREANISQSDCKLFQRFSLGLSKTFATVALKPSQVFPLKDDPDRPVMNDGCALMSRSLANEICDSLGISGNTPSCFQGRIAGAKGLWMVDRHQSHVSKDEDFWIQVSDSQLKIKPHPHYWQEPVDGEKLTFEVVKWSKPLHSVDLNIQLLGILEYGGRIKEYVAELTRAGIQSLYQEFADVLRSNNNVLCRSLVQRIRPAAEDASGLMSHKVRSLEQWTMDDAEYVVRMTEAGFSPRTFYPLRQRLNKCLKDSLGRHVNELRIQVPLSTYAFCIADPYGVLEENEVHFGFSSNWRDPKGHFEDNLLESVDVLVGRLPAHLPSDIQRRKAVWKSELRHFKDVVVFPTKGDVPLAHMLSGGDYDGDTPWICWDQNIVRRFRNSDLPTEDYPPEYFGLTKQSTPMSEVVSTDEFLQRAFTFNLTLSNLGRCTVEHERISYDESIGSTKAKELACLLSHLVDGRKSGVHLSEQAWQQYRKTISPIARRLPAYRNPERSYNPTNIIDYLKFEVAARERHEMLKKLEKTFPINESYDILDEDVIRPWNEVVKIFDANCRGRLRKVLGEITKAIEDRYIKWTNLIHSQKEYSRAARDATDSAKTIRPPSADHPIIHTWHNGEDE